MRKFLLTLAALLLCVVPAKAQDGYTVWNCSEPAPVVYLRSDVALDADLRGELMAHEGDHVAFILALHLTCEEYKAHWATVRENQIRLEAHGYCASAKWLLEHKHQPLDQSISAFAMILNTGYPFGLTYREGYVAIWRECGQEPPALEVGLVHPQ